MKINTIAIVNPTKSTEQLVVDFGKTVVKEKGKRWMINHSNPEIYNEPGKTPNVTIQEEDIIFTENTLNIPSYSIVMYHLEIK